MKGNVYDEYAEKILEQLPAVHKIDLCDISDLAVPSVYPLIFHRTGQIGKNIKYFSKNHIKTINKYLKSRSHIIVPKYVAIIHPESYTTYIGPRYTKPPVRQLTKYRMLLFETESSFVITKRICPSPSKFSLENQGKEVETHKQTQDLLNKEIDVETPEQTQDLLHQDIESEIRGQTQDLLNKEIEVEAHEQIQDIFNKEIESETPKQTQDQLNKEIEEETIEKIQDFLNKEMEVEAPEQTQDLLNIEIEAETSEQSQNLSNKELEIETLDQTQELLTPSELLDIMEEESEPQHYNFTVSSLPYSDCTHSSQSSVQSQILYEQYDSTKTLPLDIKRYRNMLLSPEKMSNEDIVGLIHITKEQFIRFNTKMCSNAISYKEDILGMYSRTMLLRLRLASCWTQEEISCLFGIPETTGREIFWTMLKQYYENNVNIPNLLLKDNIIEEVLEEAYNTMDPYFKELTKLLEDPAGIDRDVIFKYL